MTRIEHTAGPVLGNARTDAETAKRKVAELLAGLARVKRMPIE